jgi:hypothetical protein
MDVFTVIKVKMYPSESGLSSSPPQDLKNPRSNSQEWRGSGDVGGIFSS